MSSLWLPSTLRGLAQRLFESIGGLPKPSCGLVRRNVHCQTKSGTIPSENDDTAPPLLLLEGPDFYVSPTGTARTMYSLQTSDLGSSLGGGGGGGGGRRLFVEERHNLELAEKKFTVREATGYGLTAFTNAFLRPPTIPHTRSVASIRIQEIKEGIFRSAGTGATTWEASIAMALYFAAHPSLVRGDAIELGCGLGLGGLIFNIGTGASGSLHSLTLSDGCGEVVKACRQNLAMALFDNSTFEGLPPINAVELEWHSFLKTGTCENEGGYDMVIACDCAYRYDDVASFSRTAAGLLSDNPMAAIHLFGPENRAAFPEVVQYLRDSLNMNVILERLDLHRHRLKPQSSASSWEEATFESCDLASSSASTFLHVTASKKTAENDTKNLDELD